MSEKITGDFIKNAVTKCISENFKGVAVYKEKKVQGLKTPCFFVFETDVIQSKKLGNVRERTYKIDIRWLPDDNSKRKYEDCAKTGNMLCEILESIHTGEGYSRGSNIQYEIVEDVLFFYVSYTVRIKKESEEKPAMKSMKLIDSEKGE